MPPDLLDLDIATLAERLDACECFMVCRDDRGLVHETLAEAVRCAISVDDYVVANDVLTILEREVRNLIFHDYLNGEYREEVDHRISVLRLSRSHC